MHNMLWKVRSSTRVSTRLDRFPLKYNLILNDLLRVDTQYYNTFTICIKLLKLTYSLDCWVTLTYSQFLNPSLQKRGTTFQYVYWNTHTRCEFRTVTKTLQLQNLFRVPSVKHTKQYLMLPVQVSCTVKKITCTGIRWNCNILFDF